MDILKKILTDIKTEIADEFDRNFERKAFFSKKWDKRKREGKGTLLVQTGKLRRSIRSQVRGQSVVFSSSEPYAAIHNEGGTLTVTAKMRRFFWAKYYEAGGKIKYNKSGSMSKGSIRLSAEAEMWQKMALKKVGSKIVIPQRQFLGDAPEVSKAVDRIISENLKNTISKLIKQRLKSK